MLSAAAPRFQLPPAAAEYFGRTTTHFAFAQGDDVRSPREVLQEFASAETAPPYTRCPELRSDVATLISKGEAYYSKQIEKISADWLASHSQAGTRGAGPRQWERRAERRKRISISS